MRAFRIGSFLALICACSDSNSPPDGGTDAAGTDASNDVTQGSDAPADVTQGDASDGGSGLYTLTINDYLSWCNVSVNGGQATATPTPMQFAPDASVALHGDTAGSTFYWGYWQAPTLGDGGKDTNKDVTLTMTGDVTILACCPVNNTPLSCP